MTAIVLAVRIVKVSDPAELCLMVVCDRVPPAFVQQVEKHGGALAEQAGGLWQGQIAGLVLHGVETRQVLRRQGRTERLLYAFSRAFLKNPAALLPMDVEEQTVYSRLYQQVEQFRRARGVMAFDDTTVLAESFKQLMVECMKTLPRETLREIMERLPPEERLHGLPHEQIASALSPEERLRGLTPEDIQRLSPELREQLRRLLH